MKHKIKALEKTVLASRAPEPKEAGPPVNGARPPLTDEEMDTIKEALGRLLESFERYSPNDEVDAILQAFTFAMIAHGPPKETPEKGPQRRMTGEPYILHPLQVAQILTTIEADAPTIIAGLLHDTVEDGPSITVEQIAREFGAEVAELVNGVTKLKETERRQEDKAGAADKAPVPEEPADGKKKAFTSSQVQAENLRKILVYVARDFRVMLIKLADRLHNMETLYVQSPAKQSRIAEETLKIYAPLAHRIGVGSIKWKLEDLAFKYLYPDDFKAVAEQVASTRAEREALIDSLKSELSVRLSEAGVFPDIQGRPKHLYSIYNKMATQKIGFDEIFDLIALRIITNTEAECYTVLGLVHSLWKPVTGMFTDYISRPKPNMYQSLHTKVLTHEGKIIEVQIRTREMHRTAELGVAAHWSYKEGGSAKAEFDSKMSRVSDVLFNWASDNEDATEFIRSVMDDLFAEQLLVFTPRGDVIELVMGSTIVDFAYRVHTQLGDQCVGGKINGRIAPINTPLKNGDIVEVITRKSSQPSLDWLSFVKSSHAKSKIRQFHRKANQQENIQRGRETLEREAQRLGVDIHGDRVELLEKAARAMNYASLDDLLAAIGHGQAAAQTVINRLREAVQPSEDRIAVSRGSTAALEIRAGDLDESMITRAQCCSPLPGEDVVGYVTQGRGVALHNRECRNFAALAEKSPERVTEVSWTQSGGTKVPVPIKIEAIDRVGLLNDISSIFSAGDINISEAVIKRQSNRIAVMDLKPEVESVEQLERILANVRKLADVLDIYRVTSVSTPDQQPA